MKPAPDLDDRDAAVAERARNVVIDAGAGTGKTSTIVRRLVQLVAPGDDALPALEVSRVAAITFTRRAAGELQQRIRKELDAALPRRPSPIRKQRLQGALRKIDTAYIGTIHSTADRLLRELADRSGLGPQYEIVDEIEELTEHVTAILLQAASHGTLAAALSETAVGGDDALADEVAETIRMAQRAGILAHTREMQWVAHVGLSGLFHAFCQQRDNPPPLVEPVAVDLEAMREAFAELSRDADALDLEAQESPFGRWLVRYVRDAQRALGGGDLAEVFRVVSRRLDGLKRWAPKKSHHCAGDGPAYFIVKRLTGRAGQRDPERGEVAYDDENLQGPLAAWLASRLARTFPAVVGLCERVKSDRQAVDQIDLLLQLRNLLRDDREARGRCQARLDHVFVDELQDTDPLQAEIVMFLVENGNTAACWDDVEPTPGKLTIVGDPKQSIYRFRRADVVMYDRVRKRLLERDDAVLAVELTANFRSVPPLITWLNERCAALLGAAPDPDVRFDATTGQVYQRALHPGRQSEATLPVDVLPVDATVGWGKAYAGNTRLLAAEAIARWIRRFLDDPDARVIDPRDGKPREPRAGDIAVLTP